MNVHRNDCIRFKITGNDRGIALLVALGTMIIILIVGSLAMYLVNRGLTISSGQSRYQTAFEACEGGVELGLSEVDRAFIAGTVPDTGNYVIGRQHVRVVPEELYALIAEGSVIKFSRGYFGVGYGMAKGGVQIYYRVFAQAMGTGGETVKLEVVQRKRIM
jgi:hypothetical protein